MSAKNQSVRDIVILFGSTLSVMAGASIAPALSAMKLHFAEVPNVDILVKVLISVPSLFLALFSPLAGLLMDKFGRKNVLFVSILLFALSGFSGFFLDDLYLILAGRVLLGVAVAGTMTGFIALIGDLFHEDQLNRFMGIQASVMSFGGVLYLMMSGVLADINWNYPFLIYLLALICLLFFHLYISETKSLSFDDKTADNIESAKFKFDFKLILVLILGFISMSLYLMIPIQLPFFLNSIKPVSNSMIGIFMSSWIFSSATSSLFYKKLRSKLTYNSIFSIGFGIWAIGYLIMFFAGNLTLILPGLILAGVGNGLVFPNLKVLLLNISFPAFRGRAAGYLTMSLYLGQFFSPLIMEPIIKLHSISYIFLVFGLLLFLLSLIFLSKKI